MIHLIAWPLVVVSFLTKKKKLKDLGFFVGIIASIASVIVAMDRWPLAIIAVGFYWLFAWFLARIILWFQNWLKS